MNLDMVGSCNGVICLYDDLLKDVSLWNPTIHQFRHLPKSSLTFGHEIDDVVDIRRDFIGFGFDLETKDYKVVHLLYKKRIYNGHISIDIHGVEVYSLSTNSWRTLEEDVVVPADPRSDSGGYLNGSYYGLGTKNVLRSSITDITAPRFSGPFFRHPEDAVEAVWELFSFDFTKEIFKFLQLPDGWHDNMCTISHDLGIILSGGKVTIIHCHTRMEYYDFFVLNEASGAAKEEESWTRLYKIRVLDDEIFDEDIRILGISNDGEYVFVVTSDSEKLSLLNSSTRVIEELQWDWNHGNNKFKFRRKIRRAFVYRPSLVPVSSTRNSSTS